MIVRCPECQTGFNLSPEKVPAKGAKLRCSQCNHVFRVRITDGRSEIFYKNKAENIPVLNANNETQIGGLHRPEKGEAKKEAKQLATMDPGGQTSFGYPSRTGTKPRQQGMIPLVAPKVKALPLRSPILTPPAMERKVQNERPPQPIIRPSKRKLTPVPSEELDLFGDDSGFNFSNNDRSVEDPFFGAFDEPEEDTLFTPSINEMDLGEAAKSDFSSQGNSWVEETPVEEDFRIQTNSEDFFSRGGSVRNYDELAPTQTPPPIIPPDIPAPIPEISAASVELLSVPEPAPVRSAFDSRSDSKPEPKIKLAIERQPIQPTPRKKSKSSQRRPKKKNQDLAEAPRPESPIALTPHKVGGNSFRRIFDTLFIAMFLLGSFIAVIAYKTGGFFDFSDPLHMLEVAFEGKPYNLNPNLKVKKATVLGGAISPYVNNLIATPYRLRSKDHVLLVNGFINNPGSAVKTEQAVLVEISSSAGKDESGVHVGEALTINQLKARLDEKTFSTLPNLDRLAKDSSTPFFVVFRSQVRFRDLEIKTKIVSK